MKRLILTLVIGLSVAGCAKHVERPNVVCEGDVCFLEASEKIAKTQTKSVQERQKIVEVSSDDFGSVVLQSSKPVIIDFYATWCGPCKTMKPIFAELVSEHPDWLFIAVDVDKAPELVARCGVRAMPTFVIFKNGTQWGAVIGGREKEQFLQELYTVISSDEPQVTAQQDVAKSLIQRVAENNIDEIKKLIEDGADINEVMHTPLGDISPLHMAVILSTEEIIDLLKSAGALANADFETSTRKTLEMYEKVAEGLRRSLSYAQELAAVQKPIKQDELSFVGSDAAQRLISAMSDLNELEKLIAAGADVNGIMSVNGFDFAPLYMAIVSNNIEVIQTLIAAGATLQRELIAELNEPAMTIESAVNRSIERHDEMLRKAHLKLAYALEG